MTKSIKTLLKNIVVTLVIAMFFSCSNNSKEVRDFLADKNLPIGISTNVYNRYIDSGRVTSRLQAPLLHNFANRKDHPYTEFPEGVRVVSINEDNDSIVVTGDYAIIYTNTSISEIRKNVIINSAVEKKKLITEQLYWDQKTHYFYTDKPFTLYTANDTLYGVGFDASEDLKRFTAKNNRGSININEIKE